MIWENVGVFLGFLARKPIISQLQILWDNQSYWNQWNYCRYHIDMSGFLEDEKLRYVWNTSSVKNG